MPPILTADRLSKAYDRGVVLDEVSVAIDVGERIGLIGANGSGKSTLAKVLAGIEEPDRGTVARRRDASIAYLSQEPALAADCTAHEAALSGLADWFDARREYERVAQRIAEAADGPAVGALIEEQARLGTVLERLGGWDLTHRADAMLADLGIRDPEQLVGSMSGGEVRRVALAKILVSQPALAILDEPTNHLDARTIEWLEEYLIDEYAGALLLITHDRYVLDRVARRVIELDRGRATSFAGNYARYLELKAERLAHEARLEANRLNLLRRERDWLSRQAPARTRKQQARIDRAKALEDAVRRDERRRELAALSVVTADSGKRLAQMREVSCAAGGRVLVENVNLVLSPGDRVGIVGRNGVGKTTLLLVLLGEQPAAAGTVTMADRARPKYLDQKRADLDDGASVLETVAEGGDSIRVGDEWMPAPSYLDRFAFSGAKQRQSVSSLSGGERARLALAKMLRGDANLLVLDEPTNDLDLETLGILEEMLIGFAGAIVIVTHDRYFLNRLATSILALEGDGRATQYAGNYDDYVLQRDRAGREALAREPPARMRDANGLGVAIESTGEKKKRRALTQAEKVELDALPEKIEAIETEVAAIEAELADPKLYASGHDDVAGVMARHSAAQLRLAEAMQRWEQLESKHGTV